MANNVYGIHSKLIQSIPYTQWDGMAVDVWNYYPLTCLPQHQHTQSVVGGVRQGCSLTYR